MADIMNSGGGQGSNDYGGTRSQGAARSGGASSFGRNINYDNATLESAHNYRENVPLPVNGNDLEGDILPEMVRIMMTIYLSILDRTSKSNSTSDQESSQCFYVCSLLRPSEEPSLLRMISNALKTSCLMQLKGLITTSKSTRPQNSLS